MDTAWLNDLLIPLAIIGVGIYFRSYISKKGENLATKDDVGEITTKIEDVRHDYAARLESLRTTLQAKLQIDHVRYQNEYLILSALSEKVVELRDSAIGLRPSADIHDPNESEDDRKRRRLKNFNDASHQYYSLASTKKPFIPEEICEIVDELRKKSRSEAIRYAHGDPDKDPIKYWDEADKNAEVIEKLANEVMTAIRERVKTWELRETT